MSLNLRELRKWNWRIKYKAREDSEHFPFVKFDFVFCARTDFEAFTKRKKFFKPHDIASYKRKDLV